MTQTNNTLEVRHTAWYGQEGRCYDVLIPESRTAHTNNAYCLSLELEAIKEVASVALADGYRISQYTVFPRDGGTLVTGWSKKIVNEIEDGEGQ